MATGMEVAEDLARRLVQGELAMMELIRTVLPSLDYETSQELIDALKKATDWLDSNYELVRAAEIAELEDNSEAS